MSVPLNADHGENGLAFTSVDWSGQEIKAWFNYYTNRAIGPKRPAALDGIFKFYSVESFPLPPGSLNAPPWDGDPRQPRDLGGCKTDILELTDIPWRSQDALLRTVQDAPWTWPLPHHILRLTLDGYRSFDFDVYFPVPVPAVSLSGTWTLEQDYR